MHHDAVSFVLHRWGNKYGNWNTKVTKVMARYWKQWGLWWWSDSYPRYGGRGSMRQYPDIDGHLESLWEGIWFFFPQKLRVYPQKLQHSYGKWLTENNHLPNKHGDLPSDTISSSPIDDLHGHPNANWRAADPLRYPLRDAGRCATRSGRRSRRPFPVPSTKASQGYMDEM